MQIEELQNIAFSLGLIIKIQIKENSLKSLCRPLSMLSALFPI